MLIKKLFLKTIWILLKPFVSNLHISILLSYFHSRCKGLPFLIDKPIPIIINEIFIKLLEMKKISPRSYNAVFFLFKAYNSRKWLDAFIYQMMCLESLFSKEHKGDSERTICLRESTFLYDKYGTKYSDIQPLYELRSKLVHGSFVLNANTPPEENLATLKELEDLILYVFRAILDENIYRLYINVDDKEMYFNELSRTKAHLVRQNGDKKV